MTSLSMSNLSIGQEFDLMQSPLPQTSLREYFRAEIGEAERSVNEVSSQMSEVLSERQEVSIRDLRDVQAQLIAIMPTKEKTVQMAKAVEKLKSDQAFLESSLKAANQQLQEQWNQSDQLLKSMQSYRRALGKGGKHPVEAILVDQGKQACRRIQENN